MAGKSLQDLYPGKTSPNQFSEIMTSVNRSRFQEDYSFVNKKTRVNLFNLNILQCLAYDDDRGIHVRRWLRPLQVAKHRPLLCKENVWEN